MVLSVSIGHVTIMSKKVKKKLPDDTKLVPIRFLILDVDGVLTDGSIVYTSAGEEVKAFNVKDGSGLNYWHRVGYSAAIITGRKSPMVERRAAELNIPYLAMDVKYKLPEFERILTEARVEPQEVLVVGDDLMELPMMARAGVGAAVRDAMPEVREAADWVTNKKGGKGAVREIIDHILQVQGKWDTIMSRYLV